MQFATKGVYVSLDENRMDMPSYFCPSNCKDSKGRKLLYQVSNYLYKTNALSGAVEFKDHAYKVSLIEANPHPASFEIYMENLKNVSHITHGILSLSLPSAQARRSLTPEPSVCMAAT